MKERETYLAALDGHVSQLVDQAKEIEELQEAKASMTEQIQCLEKNIRASEDQLRTLTNKYHTCKE